MTGQQNFQNVKIKNNVCLIVIDGWGIREESHGNAILNACTPTMDELMKNSIIIEASETYVGLPEGQMGNSEVGHANIGAGRIVYQDILRINNSIKSGEILKNPALVSACTRAKGNSGGRIHLIGLCSDGGVHSHIDHIIGVADVCKTLGVQDCFLHCITDGRDTNPTSGVGFLKKILNHFKNSHYGHLATVVGRYYAMDRDKNWDRIKIAFDAFCHGIGLNTSEDKLLMQIEDLYALGQKHTDEFLKPFILGGPGQRISDNDTVIFLNYRSDRMRCICTSLGLQLNFESTLPKDLKIYCMTKYDPTHTFETLFPAISMENLLSHWLSCLGIKQLHVAETEKFAHVTFFFNGGVEKQCNNEDRFMVPSPKVATFDLLPQMSVIEVGNTVIEGIKSGEYPFIVVNLAPPDMVGHTGQYYPTIIACEYTDKVIEDIYKACEEFGYVLIVTADHGNAEMMYGENDSPHTAHTLFPVPLIITKGFKLFYPKTRKPALCDVATTVLDVMGCPIPPEMTGLSLIKE